MDHTTPPPRPRIAVVTVHGVADQKPNETVRTTAKMLSRAAEWANHPNIRDRIATPSSASLEYLSHPGTYSAFEEHSLRIPVVRTPTPRHGEHTATVDRKPRSKLREALTYEMQSHTIAARLDPKTATQHDDVSHSYMSELLEDYQIDGEEAIYETLRLESTRTGSKADIDLYEMYWADLSRLVGNWIRWLIEFYQLLFDLCILGRKSLGFARAQCEPQARVATNRARLAWPIFALSQVTAERALALFIPLLNLYLLGIALSMLPLLIHAPAIPVVVDCFIAIAAALAGAFGIYFKRTYFSPTGHGWPWLLILPLALLGAGASLRFTTLVEHAPYAWLMYSWWLLPLIGILWAMSAYQKNRRGAFPTALIIGALVTAAYIYNISGHHDSAPQVLSALLHTAEWIILTMLAAWTTLYVGAFVMTFAGAVAPFSAPPGDERDAARRAAWTANLTIVLPGILILILNLTLWQSLIMLGTPARTTQDTHLPTAPTGSSLLAPLKNSPLWQTRYQPCWGESRCKSFLYPESARPGTIATAVDALYKQSETPLYSVGLLLFILAAGLLVWAILPAAVAELQARRSSTSPAVRQAASAWLGESLSAGFRAIRVSGEIVRLVFVALIPIGAAAFWLFDSHLLREKRFLDDVNSLSMLVAAWLALALIAAKGPFRVLALGLHSALDIALDVINWLRIYPRQSNCRARICARFYSLLKHVEEWRSRDHGEGYQAIVILSHSQGTVIAADLLRYLNHIGRAPKLPIYLFTMGCPLRQLYGLRFPHLYGWARKSAANWPCTGPDPNDTGVALWVNAYTSGDYVGRYLWYPDFPHPTDARWSIHPAGQEQGHKREFCIGAGAHTHYWDDSAPEIAIELDQLIGFAAAGGARMPMTPTAISVVRHSR